jgi:di/tricarboxylate transporter
MTPVCNADRIAGAGAARTATDPEDDETDTRIDAGAMLPMTAPYGMLIDTVLVCGTFLALVSGRVPLQATFFGLMFIAVVLGRLKFDEVLRMLADPAIFTVIAFVLFSRVLSHMFWLKGFVFGKAIPGERRTLARFLSTVGAISALMPNTAVVGAFMGAATRHPHVSGHQLLMPLSFMALAGGMITPFGTSANLMVVGQAEKYGIHLGVLHFLVPGIAVYLAVLAALVVFTPLVLGRRTESRARREIEVFHVEAVLKPGSKLIGQSISDNNLRNLDHFYVAEVVRGGDLISPVSPNEILEEGDTLIMVGDVRYIAELQAIEGLTTNVLPGAARKQGLYHAVVGSNSMLVGTTLKDARFRTRFDASVVAIRRGHERLSGKLGEIEIRRADVLLISAGREFFERGEVNHNLHLLEVEDPAQQPISNRESAVLLAFFLGTIGLALAGIIPIAFATFVLIIGALLIGWLKERDIRRSFPFDLVVMLWGSLVLAALVDRSGLDTIMAQWILDFAPSGSTIVSLVLLFFITWLLTEALSNNSAALAALPIALELAKRLGTAPDAFVMAVAFGASASFIIPFGYQTHLMVLTPGGYRFSDFARLGAIVLIAYAIAALTAISLIYL